MNKLLKRISVIGCIVVFLSAPYFVFAETENLSNAFEKIKTVAGSEGAGYETTQTAENMAASVIKVVLSFLGVIFLVLMIYGGFLWMTDRGNSDQVETAKKIIEAAIIGLIIVLSAYAISYLVISKMSSGTLAS